MQGIELTPERPTRHTVDLGERAERAGFDTIFASHHYNNRDPFAALTLLADRTDDVRLGPGVTNPYETHPVTLASRVATLDELSDGRAVFGVGPGDPSTLENLALGEHRGLRSVLESFKVAQELWAGERVDHDGTFGAHDAGLNYEVGEIPVYVGGEGPHMCRMAAKHADGLLFNGSHPDDIAWAADQVEQGLGERPDEYGEFDFTAYASVSIAEDGDAAREAARPPVAFIAAGAPPPVIERHGLDGERADAIGEAISAGEFDAAFERVSEAMIDAFCMAGTPDRVEKRLSGVLEHADSIVIGSPLGPDVESAIDLAGAVCDRTHRE
ncbi:5,10-methylenetetrahydromethanopterin reductase [Halococcus dombrowskii]|uniref:5,10-methylenetetrahydromethanopterin reductase n=1 Tax=Halococcus dombrowskii TaxID=179637 RepID=A0AAX3AKA4_HALDO|nr:5,10-methylenetetrahydromethanopterin reductase [Halococcus dombrowskii]UOO94548.1 5,10-methylenetetrahydromethanopterin reductase [Halococcus dombrowskii]